MGVIELTNGYLLFTQDMRIEPSVKTYDIMIRKIQKWWKTIYYKLLIQKAHKKRIIKQKKTTL